jgi:hypothetical protein
VNDDNPPAAEDHDEAFCELNSCLRCYGDGCMFPPVKSARRRRRDRTERAKPKPSGMILARKMSAYEETLEELRTLGYNEYLLTPRGMEFALDMFRYFFPPLNMPSPLGSRRRAAFATVLHYATVQDRYPFDKETIREDLEVGKVVFQATFERVEKELATFKRRYRKRKLYARAEEKGKVFKYSIDAANSRQVCGRDVLGQLRAEISLQERR